MVQFNIDSRHVEDARFKKVLFGYGGDLLEVELNELQDVMNSRLARLIASVYGTRPLYLGTYVSSGGTLTITNEVVVVNRELVVIPTASLTVASNDTIYLNIQEKTMTKDNTLRKHGYEQGSEVVSNYLQDSRLGEESTRRVQVTYQLTKTNTGAGTFVKLCSLSGTTVVKNTADYEDSDLYREIRRLADEEIEQRGYVTLINSAESRATAVANGVQTNLTAHQNNTNNPHATTASQVGAYTKAEADNLLNAHKASTTDHAVATTSAPGFMASADKTKLNGIATGAEVNQNAWATILIGGVSVVADAKQDTFEMVAGTNITLTPDATNDKVTITTTAEVNQNAFATMKVGATNMASKTKTDVFEFVAGSLVTLTPDSTNNKITVALDGSVETTSGAQTKVDAHANRTDNPHNITTAQIGALPASSYTAGDVLTKLLTVDGANSGLDADLLDGLHETVFARKAITLTGGTGITTAIGDLSANRTISFDTAWGDARYANISGQTFTGAVTVPNFTNNGTTILLAKHATDATKKLSAGVGATDAYIRNEKANTYLQLNDNGTIAFEGNRLLSTADTGAGNGLNADLLDGLHETTFARKAITLTGGTGIVTSIGDLSANRTISFDTAWGDARYASAGSHAFTGTVTAPSLKGTLEHTNGYLKVQSFNTGTYGDGHARIWWNHNLGEFKIDGITNADGTTKQASLLLGSNRVLTTANEGSGKGLDADTVDGVHESSFARKAITLTGGTGIVTSIGDLSANRTISLDVSYTDGRYVNKSGGDTLTGIYTVQASNSSEMLRVKSTSTSISSYIGFYNTNQSSKTGYIGHSSTSDDKFVMYAYNGDIEIRPSTGKITTKYNGGIEEDTSIFRVGQMQTSTYLAMSSTSGLSHTFYDAGVSVLGVKYLGTSNGTQIQASNSALKLINGEVHARNSDNTAYAIFRCSSVNPSSAREYKTNIRPIEYDATELLMSTPIRNYQLKSEVEEMGASEAPTRTGLILDEAPEILRSLDTVDLYSLVGLLVSMNQQQEKRILALEAKQAV